MAATLHIHHHYYGQGQGQADSVSGRGMWDWADPKKNGVAKALDPNENGVKQIVAPLGDQNTWIDAGKTAVHYGIPATTSALGGAAGTVLGGPVGGVAGRALGSYGGAQINKAIGFGLGISKRKPRFEKGSAQAKEWGERMRAARMKR